MSGNFIVILLDKKERFIDVKKISTHDLIRQYDKEFEFIHYELNKIMVLRAYKHTKKSYKRKLFKERKIKVNLK